MKNRKLICLCTALLLLLAGVCGCTKRGTITTKEEPVSNTEQKQEQVSADGSSLLAVISDEEEQAFSLTDIDSGLIYHLTYDTTTQFTSRYKEPMAANQCEIGQIVEVSYDPATSVIRTLQISYDAWEYENVIGMTYDQSASRIYYKGTAYAYQNALVLYDKTRQKADEAAGTDASVQEVSSDASKEKVASEDAGIQTPGRRYRVALNDISDQDTVTLRGYKGKICSVVIEKGHGLVRLKDYSTYIGGMVSIGNVIEPVRKDMVLTVPVGKWTLSIDKDGKMGTKDVVVEQNKDQTISLGDLTIIAERRGIMQFHVTPEDCVITVDGQEYTDKTKFVLAYGRHRVSVSAVGYKSYNGTITVKAAYMNVNVDLVELSSSADATMNTSATTADAAATTRILQQTVTTTQSTEQTVTTEVTGQ